MPADEAVKQQLDRFETVDWVYDGLGGKVITWTREHGGESEDPSAQAFVLDRTGAFVERADDTTCYTPKSFAKWLERMADDHDAKHPRTRVPFQPAAVVLDGEGAAAKPVCEALDSARAAGKPVLVYLSCEERKDADRGQRTQAKASRAFEKKALASKQAADAAEGWVLLRVDVSRPAGAALAASFDVEKAPALLLFAPQAKEPKVLNAQTSGAALAHHLKKALGKD